MVFTPIDQPISTQASTPASSITAIASSTNASTPTASGSAGRSEPPVPRWFQEITRTPHSGSSRAGQANGLVPRPLHSSTGRAVDVVGPRPQAGAVGAGHVVVAQCQPVLCRWRDRQGGSSSDHAGDCAPAECCRTALVAQITGVAQPSPAGVSRSAPQHQVRAGLGGLPPVGEHRLDELLRLLAFLTARGQGGGGDHRVPAGLALAVLGEPRQWPQHRFDEVVHGGLPGSPRCFP